MTKMGAGGRAPAAHKTTHQNAGADELSVEGLSGALADAQTPAAHATSHQDGGTDEINLSGLSGAGGFVDRGDPAAWDKTISNFTIDGNWHDLDLSSIVPAGARFITIHMELNSPSANELVAFRKKGYTNVPHQLRAMSLLSNQVQYLDVIIPCDTNRIIQYYVQNLANFVTLNFAVTGWIL